jgi:hypothetical protein
VSEVVIIADSDTLTVTEGVETALGGTGFVPYPEIPGPQPPPPGGAHAG